ncbi:hypothetical protein H2248_011044 [Termitomyces sp. 'cryptogamus']|nr:hypothetical protein H2248_011044 [Termitomyces sp. 'cryptogamus']
MVIEIAIDPASHPSTYPDATQLSPVTPSRPQGPTFDLNKTYLNLYYSYSNDGTGPTNCSSIIPIPPA